MRRVYISLTLRPRIPHMCGFLDCFNFSHFLVFSCHFYNLKLISLNFALHFGGKKSNFCCLNVLVCCCPANHYSEIACAFSFKKQCALRVNEIKVTSRNAFIVNFCALKSEKKSKNVEKTLFRDFPRILNLSVNP